MEGFAQRPTGKHPMSFAPLRYSIVPFLLLSVVGTLRADEASAKAALEAAGFRVSGANIITQQESEISSALRNITKLRKELLNATRELAGVQGQVDELKAQIARLTQQQVGFSTQLANVPEGNVELNNKLVGALQALQGQQQLLNAQLPKADEAIATARGNWNKAREAYLQTVLTIRESIDAATELYEKGAVDASLVAAAKELSLATGKEFKIEPSRVLASASKRLEAYEDEVLSEAIPLRRQGNTLYASVVINGKYDKEMVVDSGASLLMLTGPVAKELGVAPTEKDPIIQLVMADGRQISGQLVTLDEVRVGQFTVEKVEAAVLGPDAINAEPLLGMSFLGNFKFELDAKAGTLTMVDIEGANPAEEKKPSRGR